MSAGSEIGFFVGVTLFFRRCSLIAGESGANIQGEDGVAAFGDAILHHIFPLFFVIVLLCLCPRAASGEV